MKRLWGAVAFLIVLASTASCQERQADSTRVADLVQELLPAVERLSGLTATDSIRVAVRGADSLRAYLRRELRRDLPPARARGLAATYRALGLVPDTFDLESTLVDLYTEQVIGFYDPPTKRLYVVEGAGTAALRPVVAHEMVHALQDQHTDVEALISPERGNDRQTAAQAALEGHATLVMLRLTLEETMGRPVPLENLPDLRSTIEASVQGQNARFPIFRAAPEILQWSVLYPYAAGAGFVQALWSRYPGAAPLDSLLPRSTEQVEHPASRFFPEPDPPTALRFGDGGAGGWSRVYENTFGEAELRFILRHHLDAGADSAAAGWDGDRFLLLRRNGLDVLDLVTVWDDAASAARFAAAWRSMAESRTPKRTQRIRTFSLDGLPAVTVLDGTGPLPPDTTLPVPRIVR